MTVEALFWLNVFVPVTVLIAACLHAYEEVDGRLWRYLGCVHRFPGLLHLSVPVGGFLTLAGGGSVFAAVLLAFRGTWWLEPVVPPRPDYLWLLIGLMASDALFTHFWLAYRFRWFSDANPGLPSALLYALLVVLLLVYAADVPFEPWWLLAGVAPFALLQPILSVAGRFSRRSP